MTRRYCQGRKSSTHWHVLNHNPADSPTSLCFFRWDDARLHLIHRLENQLGVFSTPRDGIEEALGMLFQLPTSYDKEVAVHAAGWVWVIVKCYLTPVICESACGMEG